MFRGVDTRTTHPEKLKPITYPLAAWVAFKIVMSIAPSPPEKKLIEHDTQIQEYNGPECRQLLCEVYDHICKHGYFVKHKQSFSTSIVFRYTYFDDFSACQVSNFDLPVVFDNGWGEGTGRVRGVARVRVSVGLGYE